MLAPPPAPHRPAGAPAKGAKRATLPKSQQPQLATLAEDPPEGPGWISEIKFDGYRLLIFLDHGKARVITRNGLDLDQPACRPWPTPPRLFLSRPPCSTVRLVFLQDDGVSSFHGLQDALSAEQDGRLNFYVFDLLYLDGWDLRPCHLIDRKNVLRGLSPWSGMLRYSDHYEGDLAEMRQEACRRGLEGIICKQANAPYRAGRSRIWLKLKCQNREEFVVLGWTPPQRSRTGLGALHLGYYDRQGLLHYVGGAGTGYSESELSNLRTRLDDLATDPPQGLLVAGDPLDPTIRWVRPELVVEIQFAGWSGAGRLRQAVYLGLREDKDAKEVVREPPDPEATRTAISPRPGRAEAARKRPKIAVPPERPAARTSRIVTAHAPKGPETVIAGVKITHPDKELWPGITKHDLADYWQAVADVALPGLTHRPLAIVRCPEGIAGEHFFQKRGHGHLPHQIREAEADGSPYLVIDGLDGLIALTQMSAIELHPWGASEADPLHPDTLVFDLDPGDGVAFADVVKAAQDVRDRLKTLGLQSFCRTTGGKGLHVIVPITPKPDWDEAKAFCHAFAETLSQEQPDRFLPTVKKVDRKGRILLDWLRNGLGATAVSSFCPRARSGATVATPIAWSEVTAKLDPTRFTMRTVPERLAKLRDDPWEGFRTFDQSLPDIPRERVKPTPGGSKRPVIVFAQKPRAKR